MVRKMALCLFLIWTVSLLNLCASLAEADDPVVVRIGEVTFTKSQIQSAVQTDISLTQMLNQEYLTDEEKRLQREDTIGRFIDAGLIEMKLREAGIRTAVLSNKRDEVTRFLCSHFFPGLFDICRGERSGVPIKPSPESVHSIMNELGVDASDTVYIGDSEVDITTARNAGTDCFIVTWGFRSREDLERSGADRLFDDVPSLFDALTSID